MPLPLPPTERTPMHTRSISVQSYARDDGLWDIEAQLVDVKAYDFTRSNGTEHKAGDPVHNLLLRVTFDQTLTITDAVAVYEAAPYGGSCSAIEPDYAAMVGMNFLRGFKQAMRAKFGRTAGCTHMTELSDVLPTVAVQSMSKVRRARQASGSNERPFQLEGCHALRLDGPVVQEYYPKWYVDAGQPAEHK